MDISTKLSQLIEEESDLKMRGFLMVMLHMATVSSQQAESCNQSVEELKALRMEFEQHVDEYQQREYARKGGQKILKIASNVVVTIIVAVLSYGFPKVSEKINSIEGQLIQDHIDIELLKGSNQPAVLSDRVITNLLTKN